MSPKQITWISFLAVLSTLNISPNAIASNDNISSKQEISIESRLNRIADNLQARKAELNNLSDSDLEKISTDNVIIGGWLNGYRGGFVNGRGGGFLNRRRWGDGGGFWNRRWPNGGGFLNRW